MESLETIRTDVKHLEHKLTKNLVLSGIAYDCAWNIEHIRGCLKSLDHLSSMHKEDLMTLNGLYLDLFSQCNKFLIKWRFS